MASQEKFILSLDQGTTSSRAVLFNRAGEPCHIDQIEFKQHYPRPGWVEHNANDLWETQRKVMFSVLEKADAKLTDIAAVGIANQRETVVVWDRTTGEALHPAIVWQDRRTSDTCRALKEAGQELFFQERTGLRLDPYFAGTKLAWLLENVDEVKTKAQAGELCFGTVDSWLIWNLTGGRVHCTDVTNASRTLLFNIHTMEWDEEILSHLKIPKSILPKVCTCSETIAPVQMNSPWDGIPISGLAGDQHAALFGQACFETGMVKNTYGTGCFALMNTGHEAVQSNHNLLTTLAWQIGSDVTYALEGSIFMGGAIVQWLRDELKLIESAQECDQFASEVEDNGGVYLVPAFAGLGAPYWDPYARGAIVGLTRGANRHHLCRAALESIAFQVTELIQCMESDLGSAMKELRVDGGATRSELLMQIQADFLQEKILQPQCEETTALGAAFLAGLAVGFWSSMEEISLLWEEKKNYKPLKHLNEIQPMLNMWKKSVERSRNWID